VVSLLESSLDGSPQNILGPFKQTARAVVVAQVEEWSLPIPEVWGSNPVIGKNLY